MGVETGSGTLAVLLASLSAIDGEAFIRAAVRTGCHAVWHVDAVVAPPAEPPGWQPQVWEYDEATFIAGQVSSRALAAALDPGDAQVLSLGGYERTFCGRMTVMSQCDHVDVCCYGRSAAFAVLG